MAKGNSHKKLVFQDNFVKHWCCSSHNHPKGWRWWKKHVRRQVRKKQALEIRREKNNDI